MVFYVDFCIKISLHVISFSELVKKTPDSGPERACTECFLVRCRPIIVRLRPEDRLPGLALLQNLYFELKQLSLLTECRITF